MWIVELALRRPYTFIVIALLIAIFSISFLLKTPKDILPDINIPIMSVVWSYDGLPAEQFAEQITTFGEFTLFNNVSDIERIESETLDGVCVIHVFFQPGVNIASAVGEATAASQSIIKRMPPGVLPPIILRYSLSSVPIIRIILSGSKTTEDEMYDFGQWRIRQFMSSIAGVTFPMPYGGKIRALMVDVDSLALQTRGLSARDVNTALVNQSLIVPVGDARIGKLDYRVNVNNTPVDPDTFNEIPIANKEGHLIFLRDVAFAHDGFSPQTNVVLVNGEKSVMMEVLKHGSASTIEIINEIKELLPTLRAVAPAGMNVDLIFDQSIFVQNAIQNVFVEGILASLLTGLMVLIFLGSWRSTLITLISIPLAVLTSILCLCAMGETINIMTLGGLALAVGILVDDATVTIENIHRHIKMGKSLKSAILDGSYEIAVPAFVSTLSICIVFLPFLTLQGASKYLFTPFALAVVFAIIASYLISRTLIPVIIYYLLPGEMYLYRGEGPKTALDRYHVKFSRSFHHLRSSYGSILKWALENRGFTLFIFGLIFLSSLLVLPFIGQDFFPSIDSGLLRLHVRAPSGTRIEVTEEIFAEVEEEIKRIIHPNNIQMIMNNIGINISPYPYPLAFGDSQTVGAYDGEILISLSDKRSQSTQDCMAMLREQLAKKFPDLLFYFQPADMMNQILNSALPSPIDIRVIGHDFENNLEIAKNLVKDISQVPGAVDTHIHQVNDFPELFLNIDRMQLAYAGINQNNAAYDILINFSDSTVVSPNFWIDKKSGIPYFIAVQNPKYRINSVEDLLNIPISSPLTKESQLLCDLCTLERRSTIGVASHYNSQPVLDIYTNIQDRDLGGVSSDIQKIVDKYQKQMKPGNKIVVTGLVVEMKNAFKNLSLGFIFAVVLVYLIMVINFQSWTDPFIILMAIPAACCGIIWCLFLTQTTFNIPSLMGAIMSVGVVAANSILLVTFANLQLKSGKSVIEVIHAAAIARFRPILMTAFSMIVGMIPMALAIGDGGEQNAPLGKAVIGGLVLATISTLFFIPVIFSYLRKSANPYLDAKKTPYVPPENLSFEEGEND